MPLQTHSFGEKARRGRALLKRKGEQASFLGLKKRRAKTMGEPA